jgi:hypothetical protein
MWLHETLQVPKELVRVNGFTLFSLFFVAIPAKKLVKLRMPIDQVEMRLQINQVIIYREGDER